MEDRLRFTSAKHWASHPSLIQGQQSGLACFYREATRSISPVLDGKASKKLSYYTLIKRGTK